MSERPFAASASERDPAKSERGPSGPARSASSGETTSERPFAASASERDPAKSERGPSGPARSTRSGETTSERPFAASASERDPAKSERPKRGLVVMAYGTPASPDDIADYYTHIRRGRAPSDEQLADLRRRYEAIGGVSPLAERTRAQVDAITAVLHEREPDTWHVEQGNKHAPPYVEDAVQALLADDGIEQIVGLVLAPHFSQGSVGEYHRRAAAPIVEANRGIVYTGIESWHDLPAWVEAQVGRVRKAREGLPEATKVLFTAHSLPERVLDRDPYPDQLRKSASAIAGELGLDPWSEWALAWQSAGRTPEPWRGPDILEVIRDLAATGRAEGVLVCPQGFVSDHLEVLYDLDVDATRVAEEVGLAFARTASINDDPAVMGGVAERVLGCGAARPWWRP